MANRADIANLISNTDSFKQAQHSMYPPGTEYLSSYIESRGGRFSVDDVRGAAGVPP